MCQKECFDNRFRCQRHLRNKLDSLHAHARSFRAPPFHSMFVFFWEVSTSQSVVVSGAEEPLSSRVWRYPVQSRRCICISVFMEQTILYPNLLFDPQSLFVLLLIPFAKARGAQRQCPAMWR